MHPSDETDDHKEVCRSLFRRTAGESCTMTPLTDWYNNTTSGRGRHQLNQWIRNTIHSLTGQQAARRRRQSGLVWLSCWASTQRVTSRIPVPTIAPSKLLIISFCNWGIQNFEEWSTSQSARKRRPYWLELVGCQHSYHQRASSDWRHSPDWNFRKSPVNFDSNRIKIVMNSTSFKAMISYTQLFSICLSQALRL